MNRVLRTGAQSLSGAARSLEEGFKCWQKQRRLDELLSGGAADEEEAGRKELQAQERCPEGKVALVCR